MAVITKSFNLHTKAELDIVNITNEVAKVVEDSGLKDGIVTIFIPGATGALTTIEYELGLLKDFPDMLERIVPQNIKYEHNKKWGDWNGHWELGSN